MKQKPRRMYVWLEKRFPSLYLDSAMLASRQTCTHGHIPFSLAKQEEPHLLKLIIIAPCTARR